MFKKRFFRQGIALTLAAAFSLSQMSVSTLADELDEKQAQEEVQAQQSQSQISIYVEMSDLEYIMNNYRYN